MHRTDLNILLDEGGFAHPMSSWAQGGQLKAYCAVTVILHLLTMSSEHFPMTRST